MYCLVKHITIDWVPMVCSPLRSTILAGPSILSPILHHTQGHSDVLVAQGDRATINYLFPSNDGQYMILKLSRDTTENNALWVAPWDGDHKFEWVKLNQNYNGQLSYFDNDGGTFTFLTSVNSDRLYLATWLYNNHGNQTFSKVLLPKDAKDRFLQSYKVIDNEYSVALYLNNVHFELFVVHKNGDTQRLDDGFQGSISVSKTLHGFFATFDGYDTPPVVKLWQKHPDGVITWSVWRETIYPLPMSGLVVSQVWYPSEDDVKIPMYILKHKDTQLDGTAPLLQYGYGGNEVSLLPQFSPIWVTFALYYNGVVAFPNIRGGSEFGLDWANSGRAESINNTAKDFIAATNYLIKNQWVSPDKTSIYGWSAGAELITRCVLWTESRTFRAAIAYKGPHDQLRFPLFDPGVYWMDALGDPSDTQGFDWLYPFSSLYNFPPHITLPATLIVAGGSDIRINKMHTYKMLATMQYGASPESGMVLLKTITGEAHDPNGRPKTLEIEDDFVLLSFLAQSMELSLAVHRS
ncbi:alpha/beta-hydrolase [Clavulina sp. PMI_390]|nr:alpha/beta-hydrolase [Clavulina sp. PMI_390]